jgi:hypothetical protein
MRGIEAEAIVLSDSVTATPAYLATPAPGVYPLLTNGFLRLLGQYLVFHRFLEHNHTKRMFLFVVPSEFVADIPDDLGSGLARYTYIDSVYTSADERRILEEGDAAAKRRIEPRFELLLKTWYPNRIAHPLSVDMLTVPVGSEPVRPDPAPRRIAPLTVQSNYTLQRFQETCRARQVECTIVQAPTAPGVPRYDMAELGRRFPGLRFVDTHDFASYPLEAFPDQMHMNRGTGLRYLSLIQAHVAPLFAESPSTWDGNLVAFGGPAAPGIFAADTYHDAEGWGAWTSAATLSMRFRVSRELRGGELRIGVRTPPQPGNAPVALSFWLDGEKMAQIASPDPQPREVVFALGAHELTPGSVHTLELRLPRTVNLRALGMSDDPRDLGPGIISIAYCVEGRCGPAA